MFKKFLLFFLLNNVHATSCQLKIDDAIVKKSSPLWMTFAEIRQHDIFLSSIESDKTDFFNFDDLYELKQGNNEWYFRLNGKAFNHLGTFQTYLYDIEFSNHRVPSIQQFQVTALSAERKPEFNRTLTMIGDSITWWQHARFFRCLLRDYGLTYDFAGRHTDVFGFHHEGEGGNKTQDVLKRIDKIQKSDAYFLLIGTNDRDSAEMTFDNIRLIVDKIHEKFPSSIIYVSTLLPRRDHFNERNQQINQLIRESDLMIFDYVKIIDTGRMIMTHSDWESFFPDTLHPDKRGYQLISEFVASQIK